MQKSLVVDSSRADGVKWKCPVCKEASSIRDGSIFADIHLFPAQAFGLLYMWAADYDNRLAVRELAVAETTVVDWYSRFRAACERWDCVYKLLATEE